MTRSFEIPIFNIVIYSIRGISFVLIVIVICVTIIDIDVDRCMTATTMIMTMAMPMIMPINTNTYYSNRSPITRVVSIIIRWVIRYVRG